MSDIGFSNLDWIIWTIVVLCFIGPPLVLGAVFLVLRIFVRRPRTLLGLYLGLSTVVSGVVLDWLSDWQNWPAIGTWAFLIGLAMAVGGWGCFILARWLRGKVKSAFRSSDS